MLINLRNALMAGKRLPYDNEIEFLESTGTQWVNTGVVSSGIDIKCLMAFTDNTVANQGVFGSRANSGDTGSNAYQIWYNISSNNLRLDWASYTKTAAVSLDTPVRIEAYQNGSIFVNGTEYTGNAKTANAYNFYIFNFNQGGALGATGCRAKVYSFQIWQNGVLVRDYIPVRKGTVGYLYDRVTGKLFGNAGTGDFVLGPDVVPVEYIENVASSYINTEFKADNACKFEIDFENTRSDNKYNPWLFGSRNGSASAVDKSCVFLGYAINTAYAMMGSAVPAFNPGSVVRGRHTLTMSLSEGVGIDGVAVATYTPSEQAQIYTNTHPNALFNLWDGSSLNNYFNGRVYSFKVLKNDVLQINFRPVRVGNGSTWEGAMMDVLTRRIYRNAGTGAFTYGNDLRYPIPAE